MSAAWLRRALGWGFDLGALALAVSVRLRAWPRHAPQRGAPSDIPEAWWEWGTLHDTILAGPDAGAWAANVRALVQGAPLDTHRLPTFTYLAGWMTRAFDDVVFAGHLVNHLIAVAVVAVTYLFGRATSGRAAGLAAAVLVALSGELVESQQHYGGDPSMQLIVLLVVATSWMAVSGSAWWLLAVGVSLGLAGATHFLALIFVPPALALLTLAPRRWWARILGVLVAAGVGWMVWQQALSEYPPVTVEQVKSVFAEGAASHGRSEEGPKLDFDAAAELVMSRADGAATMTVARGLAELSVGSVPWGLTVGLFWLGLFGPGLRRKPGPGGWDWRPALWLLAFLGPLVALEMARAPMRYGLYARPLLFLCVARGAASLGALADGLIRRWSGRWPAGLLGFVPALLLVRGLEAPMEAQWNLYPPTEKGLTLREAGTECIARFGAGGGIATSNRDFAFHAERTACMNVPCNGEDEVSLGQCLERLRVECAGEGPLPYVIENRSGHSIGDGHGFGDQPNAALDALVDEHFERIGRWPGRELSLMIYALDREALAALAKTLAGNKLRSVTPPPPPQR